MAMAAQPGLVVAHQHQISAPGTGVGLALDHASKRIGGVGCIVGGTS